MMFRWTPRHPFRASFCISSRLLLWVGLCSVLVSQPTLGEIKKDKEKAKTPMEKALDQLRRDYKALVVYYPGDEKPDKKKKNLAYLWEQVQKDRSTQKILKKELVLELSEKDIELKFPFPKTEKKKAIQPLVKDVWGLIEGEGAIVFVSYREKVILRIQDDVPRVTKFKRALKLFIAKNRAQAALAKKVEAIIEKAEYAFKLKQKRKAVLALLPWLEDKKMKTLDSTTVIKLKSIESKFKSEAQAIIKEVLVLERKLKYSEALDKLEPVTIEYPFPDIRKEAAIIRGRILRKANLGR